MKKIIIVGILAVAFGQLKAQQLKPTQPNLSLSNGLNNYFKPDADSQSLLHVNLDSANKLKLQNANLNAITVYSKMPVAKMSSTDRMPVAVPAKGEKYTMLVQKVIVNPAQPTETIVP